jgi:prevent-host-death family protein
MARSEATAVNVSEAKRHFSDLLGRVAYGGESILITRRGRPMARLVPPSASQEPRLRDLRGWLDEEDPFFEAVDKIVESRSERTPRVLLDQGRRLDER